MTATWDKEGLGSFIQNQLFQ